MALDAGSVTVDPTTGEVTGSGAALALYNAEAEALLELQLPGPSAPGDLLRDDLEEYLEGYTDF